MRGWMWAWAVLAGCAGSQRWGLPDDVPLPLEPAIEAAVEADLAALTLDEKAAMVAGDALIPTGEGWPAGGVDRLGIRPFRMTDGPRGVGLAEVATVFPVGVARAATWQPELEVAVGAAIGAEAAALGKDVLLAPTLNLVHHPRWGRAQESYGEEPIVLGTMAAAFLRGAGEHVMATAKHFAANSIEETRYDLDVVIDEATLREVYLPHFRHAVREGRPAWVMTAYNKVNGSYCGENAHLVTDILKGDWGFQGAVMSDWVWGLTDGAKALGAGLDLEMPIADAMTDVAARVASGEIDAARLDDAVRRLLRVRRTFDAVERITPSEAVVRGDAHLGLAREVAAASMVLLENDGVLPIAEGARIAVVGRLADLDNTGDRGSSNVPYADVVTPLAGLRSRFADTVPVPTDTPTEADLAAIAEADVAVVVVGLTWEEEGEGIFATSAADRDDLALPAAHEALVAQVAATGVPVVVVLEGSGPLLLASVAPVVGAVVMAWYPGQEGGSALADLLSGDVDFAGRLPMAWPAAEDQLPAYDPTALSVAYGPLHGWRWLEASGAVAAYPFGHGRSYAPSTVAVDAVPATWTLGQPFEVTGRVDGVETVQVYLRPDAPDALPAPRVLAGFARASGPFRIAIDPAWIARWDADAARMAVETGGWTVEVGVSSDAIVATAAVRLIAPN